MKEKLLNVAGFVSGVAFMLALEWLGAWLDARGEDDGTIRS